MNVDFEAGAHAMVAGDKTAREADDFRKIRFEILTRHFEPVRKPRGPLNGTLPHRDSRPRTLHQEKKVEPGVEKIALLYPGEMKEYLFSLPALNALRLSYPEAEIVMLGRQWQADFLAGRPSPIDRVEVLPPAAEQTQQGHGGGPSAEADHFVERMLGEKFDLIVQLEDGQDRGIPAAQQLGGRLTVGFQPQAGGESAPVGLFLDRSVPYTDYQMAVLRYLELVSLVGADHFSIDTQVPVIEKDVYESMRFVPPGPDPLVVIHPGGEDARFRWPPGNFAAVGARLAWSGVQVVVVGSEGERTLAEEVVRLLGGKALNLCGELPVNGMAGILSRAAFMISNDTGLLHLAAAMGTPTIGLFWSASFIHAGPLTRTRHRPFISWRTKCPICELNCTRHDCGHETSFLVDINPEAVSAAALEMLDGCRKLAQPGCLVSFDDIPGKVAL